MFLEEQEAKLLFSFDDDDVSKLLIFTLLFSARSAFSASFSCDASEDLDEDREDELFFASEDRDERFDAVAVEKFSTFSS